MPFVSHAQNTAPSAARTTARTTPATQLRPVPQEYVHKLDAAEVLLTGWAPAGEDRVTVTARWPRGHAFYAPVTGRHDPMLLAETLRQSIPLISHALYDVPLGHHLIWQHFTFEVAPGAMFLDVGPMDVELRIACGDIARRGGRLAALTMDIEILRDGRHLGTAHTRFSSHAPAIYRRLRGDRCTPSGDTIPAGPPAPPAPVARAHAKDVVLSPMPEPLSPPLSLPHQWQLRVDQTHPILFDHPVDHAPGMLLLEAARQAAHAVQDPLGGAVFPIRFESAFFRYVEFDAPCVITAHVEPSAYPEGHLGVSVTALQEDNEAFSCRVTLARATR
ncbi:gamma-butyrolactone biosynthesis enzyme [Streptomyces sp. SID335]|nr:gamma-butyrolactone biosynthesis enzyme [Streptomyces sp. SID335]MYZ15155.1 gamma-butyrolactone biosynthesis enzyme [Streptomyces sp. SID337]NDZ90454.1 gamma-butyrolactone biosynthesis enzyme [Streptomyces sp. SID10115]NEA03269.1 gamma-butyrolactone biosynthesis enzyme [Streptomyces sp. SID10116]NEB49559.1 gamma-butyrolactone biosynthesis enzyme [Streptomyces sp. SID339]